MAECKIKVKIIEAFDLDCFPGWCKAVLKDSEGVEHILVDKLPVIGLEYNEIPNLPLEKYIHVEVERDLGDMVEINTGIPNGIETEDGKSSFIVWKTLIQ